MNTYQVKQNKNCILIIDDDGINREIMKNIFPAQYTFEEAGDGLEGLRKVIEQEEKLCAILLDVNMPKMNGLELLKILHARGVTDKIPTFLITVHDEHDIAQESYELGVMDVINKPVTSFIVRRRVQSVIELFQARETLSATVQGQQRKLQENADTIDALHRATIEALATAIEFRDMESGEHVNRIHDITKYMLTCTEMGAGLTPEDISDMATAAIMHDVGKIAVSDVILNKPGKLTADEFELMKLHTVRGAELLEQISKVQTHPSYTYACDIARHHHERWDGGGYPDGLKGDEITPWAQVVSIADVYDALVSVRVYKGAFTADQAVEMIVNGECGVFNPKLIECFLQVEPEIRKWYLEDKSDTREALNRPAVSSAPAIKPDVTAMAAREVTDVMLMMTAVKEAYDMIISVNLSKNSYYMIDYDRFLNHCADSEGVFDELILAGASTVPESHRQAFLDTFSREPLLQAFGEGKRSVSLKHLQMGEDGLEHWMLTTVLFMKDGRTEDVLEITLSHCIDDEVEQQRKTKMLLSDALALAEQANNAKSDFLSRMSHDIRTPLNAILGMSTIIASHLDDPEKISESLVKISTSSKFLLSLINDILDFSKIESGRLSLNLADFDLRNTIGEVASVISYQAASKQQKFSVDVADDVEPSYLGDEFRIRQVLMNLLENAHKYTPSGGTYSLSLSRVRRRENHDILRFRVEDNGIGIRKEFLAHLFEPFSQDGDSNGRQGVGLGLPIAQNLVHLMNGELKVASEYGTGTRFTLEIPLEISAQPDTQESPIDTDVRVLVVDDEPGVCEQTVVLLERMGVFARFAESGPEALRLIRAYLATEQPFDVAIVDWKMPEMDGIETVRRIREIVGRDVLVVVMSAYDWTDIEDTARQAGVDLFIAKPISEANLRIALSCSEKFRTENVPFLFQQEKILLAEDNELNQEVVKTILEMKNLQVDIVSNGKQAVERFLATPPGEYLAIFMDVMMPVMDGHEATRQIRASQHPEASTIPIYAVTANAFHDDALEAQRSGMNGHIAKPIDFDEVSRILQTIIKDRQ